MPNYERAWVAAYIETVAIDTLTVHQRAQRSTVVLKAVMAGTGLIMIGYLLAHAFGNLKLFSGQEAFDSYSHHLRELLTPILPFGGTLWIIRVVLLASVALHMYSAITLSFRARRSVGLRGRYQSKKNRGGTTSTYASRTMRWGGVIIALFVFFHILHLTLNVIAPGGAEASPYLRTVVGFQQWYIVLVYTLAMLAIGFHLRHGLWSAFATLGANTSAAARSRLNKLSIAVAVVLVVGFLSGPFAVLIGVIK